jgi:hypothetical protein
MAKNYKFRHNGFVAYVTEKQMFEEGWVRLDEANRRIMVLEKKVLELETDCTNKALELWQLKEATKNAQTSSNGIGGRTRPYGGE